MKEATEIAKLMQLIYYSFSAIIAFAIWLARQSWITRQLGKEQAEVKKHVESLKSNIDTLREDMHARKKNEAVYKNMLGQLIDGQNEMKGKLERFIEFTHQKFMEK